MIRPANEADIAPLARLWHESWHNGHAHIAPEGLIRARTVEAFAQRLAAALPDTFVGCAADAPGGLFMLRGDEIYQFFVGRSARGSGFAAALMAAAEAELARRGVRTAWLACAVGNDRAARFYEKCGWRNVQTYVNRLEAAGEVFEVPHWRFEKRLIS